MVFVFVKIIDTDYKEDITLALESVGITKASSIESSNLEKTFGDDVSLFTGVFTSDKRKAQLIITALADDADQVKEFLGNLRAAGIDIDREEILRVVVMPVQLVFDSELGLRED